MISFGRGAARLIREELPFRLWERFVTAMHSVYDVPLIVVKNRIPQVTEKSYTFSRVMSTKNQKRYPIPSIPNFSAKLSNRIKKLILSNFFDLANILFEGGEISGEISGEIRVISPGRTPHTAPAPPPT